MSRIGDQHGIALIVALLATTLLAAIALALALTTAMDVKIAANQGSSQDVLYAADAGLDRALAELRITANWDAVLQGIQASPCVDGPSGTTRSLGDGTVIRPSDVVNTANCAHPAPCATGEISALSDDRPWGANNPRWTLYAHGPLDQFIARPSNGSPAYIIVLVADDQAEIDGDPSIDGEPGHPGAGVLLVRALAYAASGAHASIEATVFRRDAAERAQVRSWRRLR
jgi:hypothetical protein